MLYCSNRASICSHALILLSQTRWFVTTGCRTSISLQRVQTRLDCSSLLYTSVSFHPVFQTCLDYGSLSAHTHQYPALCFKHVWIMGSCLYASISLQPFDQTRSKCGSLLFTSIVSTLCFKHVQNVVPCCLHASVSSTVFPTRLECGSVSGYKHLPPALFKHV